MNFATRLLLLTLLVTSATCTMADDRPNIVLILADDIGYSDIGAYGSEIETPNIDALAASGLQLTNYHAAPTCGPSRTMMLTGVDHHRIGAGINRAGLMRLPHLQGRPGYEGYLNDKTVTFPTLLKDAGYHTFMTGKWDPGKIPGRLAADRGFERSFILAGGGASHFNDAVGTFKATADAHYYENLDEVTPLPEDFFSSDSYTDKLISYINDIDDDKPYMAYLSFTAAHWPMQITDEWIDRYRGQYDQGWLSLREQRFKKQRELGVIPSHTVLPPKNRAVDDWTALSAEQRKIESRRMEIYAAIIANMDHNIGRLIDNIENGDSDRETVVIFLADNGPEGNAVHQIIGNDKWIPERFDNSLDNMGRINSYVWLGVGWSSAAATPFRLYKSYTTAGGIRTPAIISSNRDRFTSGRKDATVAVRDIAPTILELAGVSAPAGEFNGKPVLPMSGKSALPYLQDEASSVHNDEPIGWELYGSRALLKGEWKAIRIYPPEGSGEWELFNVKTDPTEMINLAEDYAEVLAELIKDWDDYAEANGVAVFDEDLGYGRYTDEGATAP